MYVTKAEAEQALDYLDCMIDELDWAGVFIDDELDQIEKYMSMLQIYIKNSKE